MNATTRIKGPAPLCYWDGEVNRCPQCNGKSWSVGRLSAECLGCGHPLPLASATITMPPPDQAETVE